MQTEDSPLGELTRPEPISIRAARSRFGALVDQVAEGHPALICRRTAPLAVLLSSDRYEELEEAVRRDQNLAAILRAHGIVVEGWTTASVLEAIARLLEEQRQ